MRLAEGFEPATRERWMAQVERVLARGRGEVDEARLARLYRSVLTTPTHDGFRLEPLYTAEDAPPAGAEGLPGQAPFIRGAQAAPRPGGWDVRQIVPVRGDGAAAAGVALEELENGAVSVLLDLREAATIDRALLERALEGVYLEAITVALDAGTRSPAAWRALEELWSEHGVAPQRRAAVLGWDPLAEAARTADWAGLDGAMSEAAALAARVAADRPGVRTLAVDATVHHEAGASDAQQLGCALAVGVAQLRALTGAGLDIEAALGQIEFRLAATAEQFPTIASLRALRRLWSRVGEACGAPAAARAASIHAITSRAMVSRFDPWVNLLRGTVACCAAGLGGARAISVLPYDLASGVEPSPLGRRLARNTQTLLTDESGLGAVVDPAGGAWFVEELTARLSAAAWEWFQQIEAAGGMARALADGMVAERLEATWAARLDDLTHRRDPLTGISEFPNIDEPPPPGPPPSSARPAGALPARRYAEPFESQRERVERHIAAGGERPRIFLANLGTPAVHTARATFAKNLFEIAGIRAVATDGFAEDGPLAAAVAAEGAPLACICSSDAVYAERAVAVARAVAEAGVTRLYLAGRPGELEPALRAAGVDEFIHVGVDVRDVIARALDAVGVER